MKKLYLGVILAAGILCMSGCGKTQETEAVNTETEKPAPVEVTTAQAEEPEPEAEPAEEQDEPVKKEAVEVEEKEPDLSEVKKSCKKLMEELQDYEYVAMSESQPYEVGQKKTIHLDSREITRAAGLSLPYNSMEEFRLVQLDSGGFGIAEDETEYSECGGVELSSKDINRAARDLFAKDADMDTLSTDGNGNCDVIKLADGSDRIVSMCSYMETDADFVVRKGSIKKSKKGYVYTQKVYYGYWGCNDEKSSNYLISCEIEREESSKYGYVLSGMQIKRTDDEFGWNREDESMDAVEVSDSPEPFYGIWCYGVKSESEAENGVKALSANGLDGYIFVTTDWSNLNPEKWYVVTAGVYDSKEEAKNALSAVKSAGYPDAYVKYTGDYIGD